MVEEDEVAHERAVEAIAAPCWQQLPLRQRPWDGRYGRGPIEPKDSVAEWRPQQQQLQPLWPHLKSVA